MKKLITAILLVAMVLSFASCQSGSDNGTTAPSETVTQKVISINLTELKNTIITEASIEEPTEISKETFCDMFAIDANYVAEAVYFVTMDGTFPDEIIMVKATNNEAKARITDILNEHLQDVTNQSENYDAENLAIVKECKVVSAGDYVALFISAKHAQMETAFNNAASK